MFKRREKKSYGALKQSKNENLGLLLSREWQRNGNDDQQSNWLPPGGFTLRQDLQSELKILSFLCTYPKHSISLGFTILLRNIGQVG